MFKYRCFSSLRSRWWCAWQLFWPFHSCTNLPALLWLVLWGCKHTGGGHKIVMKWRMYVHEGAIESIDMFFMCACWRRAAERNVIFGERPLALALRWPLTQIKLPQFSPSPLLPQPPSAAHCQALLFSHGRLLREHAHICGFRGWQQSVLCLSSFFTPTYPSTQIELFSHFLSSLLNHLPMPYLPIMSNFIVKSIRAKHQVLWSFPLPSSSPRWMYQESGAPKTWSLKTSWILIRNWRTAHGASSNFGSWGIHLFKWPTRRKQTFWSFWVPAKPLAWAHG